MKLHKKNLKKLKGDASSRIFYRKKNKKRTSIIVYAKKEKKKNLLIYDAINKILNKNSIKAPRILSSNYNQNYIEIEDFGKISIYSILKRKKKRFQIFKKIIFLLKNIQKIKEKKLNILKKKITFCLFIQKNYYLMKLNFLCNGMCQKIYQKKRLLFLIKNFLMKSNICFHS